MSNRIQAGRPLAQETRRLFDQQLRDAVSCITKGQPRDRGAAVNVARKHVKKARAVLQLIKTTIGDEYQRADGALRIVNRALGPLADAYRMSETLERVHSREWVRLPHVALEAMRVWLATHATAVEERASLDAIRSRAVRLIDSTRRQALAWNLSALDRDAVVAEIRFIRSESRRARRLARRRPSTETYHCWRRRVKREAHAFRFISHLVGDRLRDEQRQLAALDQCLGDMHDVGVLIAVIAADLPLPRRSTAPTIRVLRAAAADLRRRAHELAAVLDEPPRSLAKRTRALWGIAPRTTAAEAVERWRRPA